MRKAALGVFFILSAMLIFSSCPAGARAADSQSSTESATTYNPQTVYSGIFDATRLYWRYSSTFWKGGAQPARLQNVTCGEALLALEEVGQWTGALNRNGSCANGDPRIWATGNFINFTMSAQP